VAYEYDDSYNDVATRLTEFRGKHPDGRLRPLDPACPFRFEQVGDRLFVVVVAAAYRSPDDPLPGVGMAWEPFPGRTPYTKDSELQNAETAAWGRAIVAALAADTRRVASRDEVRNRQADRDAPAPASTDPMWLADVQQDIARADDEDALRALWASVLAEQAAGRVTDADREELSQRTKAALGRLRSAPPGAQVEGKEGEAA
jgi:hypothetical protein